VINAPYQWQLVRVQFDPVRGSEQAGIRPALIVSDETVNAAISLVTVLPATSLKPGRFIYDTEALLPAGIAGQPNDSIVMAHQVRAISKERLLTSYGYLNDETLREQVRSALRTYLDLLCSENTERQPLYVYLSVPRSGFHAHRRTEFMRSNMECPQLRLAGFLKEKSRGRDKDSARFRGRSQADTADISLPGSVQPAAQSREKADHGAALDALVARSACASAGETRRDCGRQRGRRER
jgi:mRNA interferase MazF